MWRAVENHNHICVRYYVQKDFQIWSLTKSSHVIDKISIFPKITPNSTYLQKS